jgi:homoserine dehydrogenase
MGYIPEAVKDLTIKPMDEIISRYFLRFAADDKPGVLSQVSGILGRYDISITSMIQPERQIGGAIPIVMMTHDAKEANVRKALAEIDALAVIKEQSRFIRIENDLG